MRSLGQIGKGDRHRELPVGWVLGSELDRERGQIERESVADPRDVERSNDAVTVRPAPASALRRDEPALDDHVPIGRGSLDDGSAVERERNPAPEDEHTGAVVEREWRDDEVPRFAVEGPTVQEHLALEVVRALDDDRAEG
jgi:hypothetical protein